MVTLCGIAISFQRPEALADVCTSVERQLTKREAVAGAMRAHNSMTCSKHNLGAEESEGRGLRRARA